MAGYGTDEGFAAYAAENGHTVPSGTVAAARQRASVYIDGLYGRRFPGSPTGGASQEREWPRSGATDYYAASIADDEVPARVLNACYEATRFELETPGFFAATYTADQRKVLTEVKGIKWTVVPGDKTKKGFMAAVPVSTVIEGILWPLLIRDDLPAAIVV